MCVFMKLTFYQWDCMEVFCTKFFMCVCVCVCVCVYIYIYIYIYISDNI